MRWLRTVLMPMVLTAGVALSSEGVNEVLRLQQADVGDEVMMAYVQNSEIAFDPTADEIDSMQNAGVPATVIVAMIDRGDQLRASRNGEASAAAPADTTADATGAPVPSDTQAVRYTAEAPAPARPGPTYQETGDSFYAPGNEVNISYFYGSLAPYGSWHRVERYGYVWRPTVAIHVADWRPYCTSGHWVWTDHGWYWESEYPWGWATFHYGRWYHDSHYGWCWVPGTVWGPSWVHWRTSDRYYGWAPLPPEAHYDVGVGFSFHGDHVGFDFHFGLGYDHYAFVPAHSFLSVDIGRHRVPRREVRNVYNNTTIVNNTYIYNDNRIINQGVPVQTVAQRTNRDVETVQVTNLNVDSGETFQRGEVREGRRIRAFRPEVANEAPAEPQQAARQIQERRQEAVERRRTRRGGREAQAQQADPSAQQQTQQADSAAQQQPQQADPATQQQREAQAQERLQTERARRRQRAEERQRQEDPAAQDRTRQGQPEAGTQQTQKAERNRERGRRQAEEAARQRLERERLQRESESGIQSRQQPQDARGNRDRSRRQAEEEARQRLERERSQREAEARGRARQQAEEAQRSQERARQQAAEAARQRLERERSQREAEARGRAR